MRSFLGAQSLRDTLCETNDKGGLGRMLGIGMATVPMQQ